MPPSKPITVVITRFDDLLARGLLQVIDSDASIEIVADNVTQARLGVVLRAHRPRVAIIDGDELLSLADIRHLSDDHPSVRLVLLSAHPATAESAQALAFGASAFLGKDTQARDVLSAIHLASRGLQLIPRALLAHAIDDQQRSETQVLTRREAEVLPMLQQGKSNMQIALALQVGIETVRTHASNIYRKLGVASRRELGAIAQRAPARDDDDGAVPLPARRRAGADRLRRPGALRR